MWPPTSAFFSESLVYCLYALKSTSSTSLRTLRGIAKADRSPCSLEPLEWEKDWHTFPRQGWEEYGHLQDIHAPSGKEAIRGDSHIITLPKKTHGRVNSRPFSESTGNHCFHRQLLLQGLLARNPQVYAGSCCVAATSFLQGFHEGTVPYHGSHWWVNLGDPGWRVRCCQCTYKVRLFSRVFALFAPSAEPI